MTHSHSNTLYFVSRQVCGTRHEHIVEVAEGGFDAAGDMTQTVRYPLLGEGRNYLDPVLAVEIAIRLQKRWSQDLYLDGLGGTRKTPVRLVCGDSHGDSTSLPRLSVEEARTWAIEQMEQLETLHSCSLAEMDLQLYREEIGKLTTQFTALLVSRVTREILLICPRSHIAQFYIVGAPGTYCFDGTPYLTGEGKLPPVWPSNVALSHDLMTELSSVFGPLTKASQLLIDLTTAQVLYHQPADTRLLAVAAS